MYKICDNNDNNNNNNNNNSRLFVVIKGSNHMQSVITSKMSHKEAVAIKRNTQISTGIELLYTNAEFTTMS